MLIPERLRRLLPAFMYIFIPPALFLLLLAAIGHKAGLPMIAFMRDSFHFTKLPVYVGVGSSLGALMWCAAAAICIFTFLALAPGREDRAGRRLKLFIFFSGAFSLLLLLDDFYLLHEFVLPYMFGGRVPESVFTSIYPLLAVAYLGVFWRTILSTDYPLLLAALLLLALSMLMDVLQDPRDRTSFLSLYEDWPKFMGIAGWLGYHTRTCLQALRSARSG